MGKGSSEVKGIKLACTRTQIQTPIPHGFKNIAKVGNVGPKIPQM